jgi:hypothetical protein
MDAFAGGRGLLPTIAAIGKKPPHLIVQLISREPKILRHSLRFFVDPHLWLEDSVDVARRTVSALRQRHRTSADDERV